MVKILDLEERPNTNLYLMSGSVLPSSEYLRQPNVQPDYDVQSVVDSISSSTKSLARPEVGSDDLRYQSVEQLNREMETAILSSLKLKNDWAECCTYDERDSLGSQKRVWDTRLSAVRDALLERIPEEREQYLQKLDDIIQDWKEKELAHEEKRKMRQAERAREETATEIAARHKKQMEERIKKYCPSLSSDSSTSSSGSPSTWKFLRGKLGSFKDFILGGSSEMKTKESPGNKKLNDIQPQTEQKQSMKTTPTTTNNLQSKKTEARGLDEWHEANPTSADNSPMAGTRVETRAESLLKSPTIAPMRLAEAEVCQYNYRNSS
jgi:hypothetical protein